MRASAFLAVTAMLLAAPADAAERTLDGWRQFKFGMTPDQVRALPPLGQPWQSLAISPGYSSLTSLGPAKEFGFDFDILGTTFKTERGLVNIDLSSKRTTSAEDCKQSFLTVMPAVEARYGSFAALGWGLPPGSTVSIHDIRGAKSQYRLANTPNGFRMEAVRTFGTRYISVRANYVGPKGGAACFTDVWFQQPEPD